ncbi:MAG: DUF1295 domain-containing protein [Patescibacteria group bacterium]
MDFWQTAGLSGLAGFAFLNLVFLYAFGKKRYDVIDSAWGMTFIVICLTSYNLSENTDVGLLALVMVIVWGVRLSSHIFSRFVRSKTEDPRYVELRKNWKGSVAVNTYFRIFLAQAVLAFLICIPVIVLNVYAKTDWSWLIMAGIVVWVVGYMIEKTADNQLRKFVSQDKNRGKIMQSGLWKYSRHPNYFGEITLWWGMLLISLGATSVWWAIIGPLTITYLIIFVSGLPPNEKRFEGKPGWKEYKSKTSVLIPLPQKAK